MRTIRTLIEAWRRRRHTLTVSQPVQMVRDGDVMVSTEPIVLDVQASDIDLRYVRAALRG